MIRLVYVLLPLMILLAACESGENAFFIDESGTLETRNIIISSRTGGEVIRLNADEGTIVNAGDLLAVIDTSIYSLQAAQSKALMDVAHATVKLVREGARKEDKIQAEEMLTQAEADFNLAEADKNRFEKLYEQKAVTKKQLDEIKTRFNISQSRLNSARANLKKVSNISRPAEIKQATANYERATAAYKLAKKNLQDCFITAPINGIVANNFVEKNETVAPLSSLFKINDLSVAELSIYIPETALPRVKQGQKAEVSIDAFPDKKYEGKVTYISPEAEFTPKNIQTKDERTKLVFEVKISVPNPENELKPGLPADARIILNDDQNE
ncbi:MAG: hemolysin secretion protein D [Melioribacteraceae bacterium]|nr:MAG: hemolysin secretion protein D [Melioribacteraceae bacterium]